MSLENMINRIHIKVKKLNPEAKIPTLSTEHAAGFDFYSIEDYELKPHETYPVKTGVAVEIPIGKVLHIWDRSGMGMKGLTILGGVIDSDYRGEIKAILCNTSNEFKEIKKGDRICQGVIIDYYTPEIEEVQELPETKRGENWNSSTGR
jgi:dUTP pyrophosphatase